MLAHHRPESVIDFHSKQLLASQQQQQQQQQQLLYSASIAPITALSQPAPAYLRGAHPAPTTVNPSDLYLSSSSRTSYQHQHQSTMTSTMAAPAMHHTAVAAPPPPHYTRSSSGVPERQTSPARRHLAPTSAPQPPVTTTATATSAKTTTAASSKDKKPALPPPPKVIIDSEGRAFRRGGLLGQGGFARVYEAIDPEGQHKAFKVIAKSAIAKSRKNRQKILAEIMIHKSIDHIHVVKFEDCFEDEENVYFRLELCKNGSLNDIVKRRGPYTESEARYFMIQILAGTQNMHTNFIIHRDLKLGNVFLDEKMNVKIGDFGLAALLKYPEERKKTVCGTPNYIAPEILYDEGGKGHSFEVDIWSVGVILYTLLVGKPPFQTSKVDEIYERIRNNFYHIPSSAGISEEAKDLITKILTPNPSQRPSLVQIMNHDWFRCGPIPLRVPSTACKGTPFLPPITARESLRNWELLKQQAGWNDRADDEEEEQNQAQAAGETYVQASDHLTASSEPVEILLDPRSELEQAEQAELKREKMDREFNQAIQPESPISALLKAGKQPLVKVPPPSSSSSSSAATAGSGAGATFSSAARSTAHSLARQLSSLTLSRTSTNSTTTATASNGATAAADKENAQPSAMGPPHNIGAAGKPEFGRSYSRNTNTAASVVNHETKSATAYNNKTGRPGTATSIASVASTTTRPLSSTIGSAQPTDDVVGGGVMTRSGSSRGTLVSVGSSTGLSSGSNNKRSATSLELLISTLTTALTCLDNNTAYIAPPASTSTSTSTSGGMDTDVDTNPNANANAITFVSQPCDLNGTRIVPASPKVFLISWLDHSEKYGLGYALSDGTVGVHFRDSTSMVLAPNKANIDYISTLRSSSSSRTPATTSATSTTNAKMDQLKRENFSLSPTTTTTESSVTAEVGGSSGAPAPCVPRELHSRVRVMKYFETEIMERLYGSESGLTYQDLALNTGMTFIHKWYRCKDAIVFRLSNGMVQFNFYDHTKLFLSHQGQVISVLETLQTTSSVKVATQKLTSWTLTDFIDIALNNRAQRETEYFEKLKFNLPTTTTTTTNNTGMYRTKPAERRHIRSLVKKVKYARDVLLTTTTASTTASTATGKLSKSSSTTSVN